MNTTDKPSILLYIIYAKLYNDYVVFYLKVRQMCL